MNFKYIYNNYSLLICLRAFFWLLISISCLITSDIIYAQDPDDSGEMFWDDEEEDLDGEEEEEEEYLEDDFGDEYDDDEEVEEYMDDEGLDIEAYNDEESFDISEELTLPEESNKTGWSVDISGSLPTLINYNLYDKFSLSDSVWSPTPHGRVSVEAPYLINLYGMKFRVGAEFGVFSFADFSGREAELSGTSILGIVSFPAGPGKIKMGTGIFGSSTAIMFEASYGIPLGSLELRAGIRSTELSKATDSVNRALGHVGWMDALFVIGVNI